MRYPFSSRTKDMVKLLKFDLESPDPLVVERAKQRVIDGVERNLVEPETQSRNDKILIREMLAFPLAKILASLSGDSFVKRRYARAEANALRRFLEKEPQFASQLSADLGVPITEGFVPFVAYANAAPEQYKLVNAELDSGRVRLRRQETLVEFVAELFRQRIEEDIAKPMKVPKRYTSIAAEIKGEVNRDKAYSSVKEMNLGPVTTSEFPPCITALIELAQSGAPMAHQPRFTLSTFLINANMPIDPIIEIFRPTPNFNENKTRYYIEYSMGKKGSGTKYSAPSCEKMKFYGTCVNPDALCGRIKHPLSYYIVKMRSKKQAGDKSGA